MHTPEQSLYDVAATALAHPLYGDMLVLLIWFGLAAAIGLAFGTWHEHRQSKRGAVTFNRHTRHRLIFTRSR